MKKKKTQTPKAGKLAMLSTLLHGSRYLFVFGILASLCTTLLTALIPRVVGVTVDSIVGDKAPDYPFLLSFFGGREYLRGHLYVVALLLLAVGVLCALCRYGSFWFNAKGAETLSRNMREKLYAKVVRLPLSWHSSNHTGDIIQRCTSDTELLRTFIADQLTGLVNTVIVIFISLVMVFTLCPTLAIVTLVTVPVVVSYSLIFYFKCAGLFTEYDENEGKLSAIAQENLTGSRVVKAFGREAYERDKFDRQNRYYTTRGMRLCRVLSLYWGVGDFVTGAQMLAVLVFGAYIAVSGAFGGLSAGNYISFLSYNAMMIWPVRSLGRMISEMSKAGVAVERIAYVMNAEEEKDTGKKPFVPGDICFDHVSFSYGESQVLQDVSFTLKQGEVLGILGGTGSGKSTLLLLLCKLYTPSAGRITVGGVDIADISTASLRQGIGMVMQEPFLFSGTLSENIHITATQPDMAAVRAAADAACLDETAMAFEHGYDTVVGERGVTLSGGQKQRAAIARMLVGHHPVMVLDDSLSAVDTQTDARIRAALREKFAGATVLMVAHRVNTLMQADRVLVLEGGRVAQWGTPKVLAAEEGLFRRIARIQMAVPEETEVGA